MKNKINDQTVEKTEVVSRVDMLEKETNDLKNVISELKSQAAGSHQEHEKKVERLESRIEQLQEELSEYVSANETLRQEKEELVK